MTQRIRGITDEQATGPTKDLFDASNKMLGRTANLKAELEIVNLHEKMDRLTNDVLLKLEQIQRGLKGPR